MRSELLVLRSNLYEVQTRLQQPLALSKTGLALDAHINGAYRNLEVKSEGITTQLSKVIIIVKKVLSHTSDMFTILLPTIETVDDLCQEFSRLKVDCDSLLLNAQEVLALRDLHAGWIQMVDQIQRISNYISILKSTTDVDNFLRRQDTLIDNLMEGLSVSGITHYSELYNKYHPFVETLYIEVSTAIRAVELAHSHPSGEISPKNQNQSHDLFKARKEIMKSYS